jgi:hypothetical protein
VIRNLINYIAYIIIGFFCSVQNSYAINGSFKTYFSELKNPNDSSFDGAISGIFRPKYTGTINEFLTFHGAYALSLDWQKISPIVLNQQEPIRSYRATDLDRELTSTHKSKSHELSVNQNLDRFYINYSKGAFNLNAGRAPIAFGSSKIINPTDVLTPITYATLDKEERIGVDTVRVNYSLGALSLLDIGYVLGEDLIFSKSAAFVRLKTNVVATDVSAIVMDFKNNLMLGIDFARSIGNASAWFESAYVVPRYFKKSESANLDNYYRATIGMDYKLTESIYSYIEYHYNGAGTGDSQRYLYSQFKVPYKEGGVYLYGVHYVAPGMTYEMSALWKLTAQCLYNFNDTSIFNNLLLEYNIVQDAFIDLGAYMPLGRLQKSEFGNYPKTIYTALRMYF